MCSCKNKTKAAPPLPEFSASESGGVFVQVGAQSDIILISPTIGKVKLRYGHTASFRYNEARSFKEHGAPIWITEI